MAKEKKVTTKMSIEEKIKKLKKVASAINDSSGEIVCGFIDESVIQDKLTIKFIPTPNDDLNEGIGGGFPIGRCSVVSGLSDSGKTSLLLETIGKAMKRDENFVALWLESEQSITDLQYLKETFGIDFGRFLFIKTNLNEGAEAALDKCEALLRCGGINMFCVNSLKALVPKSELNKSITEDTVAMQARMNAKMLKKFLIICNEHDTAMVIVQHLTTLIGTMSRDPYSLGGGQLLKYGALLILDMRKQSISDSDPINKEEGMKICISVKKNHVVPKINPYVKVYHYVVYGEGTEVVFTTLNKAVEQGILTKSGAWINWPEKQLKWCGKQEFRRAMKEDSNLLQTLRNFVSKEVEELTPEEMEALGISEEDESIKDNFINDEEE